MSVCAEVVEVANGWLCVPKRARRAKSEIASTGSALSRLVRSGSTYRRTGRGSPFGCGPARIGMAVRQRSTRPCRTPLGSTTSGSAARTTSPPTASSPTASCSGADHAGQVRVNRAFLGRVGPLPRRGRGHPAVPRHRGRATNRPQHPPGGAGDRARRPGSLYVDNDPVVVAHARALMASNGPGQTGFVQADLRDPDSIMHHPAFAGTLDLTQPVGVLMLAVLMLIPGRRRAPLRRGVEAADACCRRAAAWR